MASIFRTACAAALGLVIAGILASPARPDPASPRLSVDLLARLVQKNAAGNVVLSPYSLTAVLAMLETGAAGRTRAKLRTALGIKSDEDALRFREGQHVMLGELRLAGPEVILHTANGLWNSPGLALNAAYAAALRADFDALPTSLDFTQAAAPAAVNAWVREKTDGAIPVLVEEFPKETLLLLANAVHFKAKWSVPFDPGETRQAPFTRADGEARPASMMSRKGEYAYHEGKAGQAVRLPYGDGRFAMTLLLPPEKSARSLTPGLVAALLQLDRYKPREGTVTFPRFSFDALLRLADLRNEARLGELFGNGDNYQGISATQFRVSQVIQRLAVSVDETGTEGAAATAALAERGLGGPGPFTMICNRPFYFIIDDAKTGAVLFIAHIGDAAA
jgi:serpin B